MERPVTVVPPAPEVEPAPPEPDSHEEQVQQLLAELEEPLRIRLLVHAPGEEELNGELERAARALVQRAPRSGRLDVQDPLESDEALEEARLLGIQPLGHPGTRLRLPELPRDGAYRAMVIAIGSRYLVVPQVTGDGGSAELQVAEAVSRFLHGPRLVGLVTSPARDRELLKLRRVLRRLDVRPVSLGAPLSKELSAIVVVGPGEPLSPPEVESLASFFRKGGSVALLLDGMEVVPEKTRYRVAPARTGLETFLRDQGVRISRDLVLDRVCGRVSVPARVGRMMLSYPPFPLATVSPGEVAPGARSVRLPFPSSLEVSAAEGVRVTDLLTTSAESWALERGFDLSPHQRWEARAPTKSRRVGVAIETASDPPGRLAVVANARFVEDQHLDADDNALFLRQLLEWLGGHRALSSMMYEEGEEAEDGAP